VITRRTLTGPGLTRRVFTLLAVPAIMAGILAMHFLTGLSATGAPSHQMDAPLTVVAAPHLMGETDAVPTADGCSTVCSPTHEMTAMACLLLVLLVALVLLGASVGGPLGWLSPRAMLSRISVALAGLAPPKTPSLTVLSISRT
jgi:hypothetical protein